MEQNIANIIVRGKPILPYLKENSLQKTALIVTGGGLQGSRSIGMLCSLESLGYNKSFDAAYGVSCGAANIAYFLANQAKLASSVYCQDLTDGNFAHPLRWPVVNVDYLVDEVFTKRKCLDANCVQSSCVDFQIPLTDKDGNGIFIKVGKDMDVFTALRLAMEIGFWAGEGKKWDGENYYDGLMSEPIPFRKAISDGYKNLVVLLNMPVEWVDKEDNLLLKSFKKKWLGTLSPKLRTVYLGRQKRYQDQLQDLRQGIIPEDVNITIIAPSVTCTSLPFYTPLKSVLKTAVEEGITIAKEACKMPITVELE